VERLLAAMDAVESLSRHRRIDRDDPDVTASLKRSRVGCLLAMLLELGERCSEVFGSGALDC